MSILKRCGDWRMSRWQPSQAETQRQRQRLGAGFAVPTITPDYREILRDPAIDAVHICTPNAQHFPMAKDALQAGKHVLCEKPLATSVEEGQELVALAAQQGVRNCVCHNLRYYPMVQQMRAHARSRRPGRNSRRAGHVFAGLAALRHGLELARRRQSRRAFALHGRHRLPLVRHG